MPAIFNPDLAPLVGSWCLLSVGSTFTDTMERIEPWGPNPEGRMVFDSGGRIVFIFTKPNREPPTNDTERARLFDGLLAYTGLVRLDGPGRLITTVDVAWNPAFGGEQLRFFAIDDDRLTIRTAEHINPQFPMRKLVADVIFMRELPTA